MFDDTKRASRISLIFSSSSGGEGVVVQIRSWEVDDCQHNLPVLHHNVNRLNPLNSRHLKTQSARFKKTTVVLFICAAMECIVSCDYMRSRLILVFRCLL